MAKLTHTELFRFANFAPGLRKKVGNNREVIHIRCEHEDQIIGLLHGHPVLTITRHTVGKLDGTLIADHCGYQTRTTAAAMHDFAKAAGFALSVSFAEGDFTARYQGQNFESRGQRSISFWLIEA